jgi:KipI family sensor histidine kinase inhibitor
VQTLTVDGPIRLRGVGHRAVLAELPDTAHALALATWARSARVGAEEIVPGAVTVLFDGVEDPDALRTVLATWSPEAAPEPGELVEVPVSYDGADLEDVARLWGTDAAGVVERHTGLEFVSAFCGFAPGFAYLTGLPDELAVPRLESPRPSVPAGSVALAGSWCGVYPTSSPGGWRLIGRTEVLLWSPERADPALLVPGTRVRFVAR